MNHKDVINTGTLIQIEIVKDDKSVQHYNTIVDSPIDSDGYFDIIAPLQSHVYVKIPIKYKCSISYMVKIDDKKEPISFEAEVVDYLKSSDTDYETQPPMIRLKKLSDPAPTQRRNAFRVDVAIEGNYKIITKDELNVLNEVYIAHRKKELLGTRMGSGNENLSILEDESVKILTPNSANVSFTTKDISATGFRASCGQKMSAGDNILIFIALNETQYKLPALVLDCVKNENQPGTYIFRAVYELNDNRTVDRLTRSLITIQSQEIKTMIEKGVYDEHEVSDVVPSSSAPVDFMSSYIQSMNIFSVLSIISLTLYYLSSAPRQVWGWEKMLNFTPQVYSWNLTTIAIARGLCIPLIALNVISIIFSFSRVKKYGETHGETVKLIPFAVIILSLILIYVTSQHL